MIKKSTSVAVLVYGLAIMILGSLGYFLSQSKVSLISGLLSGSALILSSLAMLAHKKLGMYASLSLTVLLTIVFCFRYRATEGHIPAILAIISGGMLIYLLAQTAKWKKY